jgi:hypothetical protein
MTTQISPSTRTVGLWSAVVATVFGITRDVGQIAEWLGWLGWLGSGTRRVGTQHGRA